jgi:hypothetical protein
MFGISQVVPAIRSSKPQLPMVGRLSGALRVGNSLSSRFPRTCKARKPAACFARRVKRAAQKYISFRMTEIMI